MNKPDYEEILIRVLDILKMEHAIDDIDWGVGNNSEILNIFIQNKIYSFEQKYNCKNIKITIDTLEN